MRSKVYIDSNQRKRIKIYCEIEAVQDARPDLNDDQAEKVTEAINEAVDFKEVFSLVGNLEYWSTILEYADKLFPTTESTE